jgi:hypothetical protein
LQCSLGLKCPKTRQGNYIKERLLENTSKRFDGIENQTITPHFSRATLLDPRCKKVAFGLTQNANDAEINLVSEISTLMRNVSNTGK